MRTGGVVVGLVMLLASCSWTAGDQYFIHWGPLRDDVIIRERTSWDLGLGRRLFYDNNDEFAKELGGFTCHANHNWSVADVCVLKLLNKQTAIPDLASGLWGRATDYVPGIRLDDFRGAFGRVRATADDELQVSDCLTVSFSVVSINWTSRERSDSDCRVGKHAWE